MYNLRLVMVLIFIMMFQGLLHFLMLVIRMAMGMVRVVNERLGLYVPLVVVNDVVRVMMVNNQVTFLTMLVIIMMVNKLVLAVRHKFHVVNIVFAEEMRVNESVMDGRDLNTIGVCHQLVVVAHHFRMKRLLGHLLHELLDGLGVMGNVANIEVGLHLDDKVALLCVHVCRMEDARVGAKRPTLLEPTAVIKVIEVITPVE